MNCSKILILGLCVVPIMANGQDREVRKAKPSSRLLEEIVVTAQKREESLSDVPIAVAAYSADALDARGIVDATDLELITPSMVYDELVGYSIIYLRGVGTDVFLPNQDASVATYIDGVYYPFAHGLAQDFTPLERIEVLKGPQGTLFGRNATAGAINIITKSPSDEWTGSVNVGVGSYSDRRVKAYVSGPLVDSIAFSLSGLVSQDEPYYKIAADSPLDKLEDNNTSGFNARLRWQPTDSISVSLSYLEAEFDGTFNIVTSQTEVTTLGELAGGRNTGPRETAFSDPGTIDSESDVLSAVMEYTGGFFDAKLILAQQEHITDTRWDYDNGPLSIVSFYPTKQFSDVRTAELQFLSNEGTPWSEKLEWIAGAYYFENEGGFDPNWVSVANPGNPGIPGDLLNPLLGILSGLGVDIGNPVALNLRGILETESSAYFAQLTWSPLEWIGLTLGGRYQVEDRMLTKSRTGYTNCGPDESAGNDSCDTILFDYAPGGRGPEISGNEFTPRVAIDFKIWDDTLLYASWSEGFKSGTMNIQAIYTPPSEVKPEFVTAYELGAKGSLFDGSLKYTTAIFLNEIEDLQTQVVSAAAGGLIVLENAASAEMAGFEVDLVWQMFPNNFPGFVATFSGAYLDTEYTDYPEGSGFDETTGLAFGPAALTGVARDFTGNRTVRAPETSGTFGLGYTFQVPGGQLEIGSEIYYNSGYFFDTQNATEQPEYYLLNARANYYIEKWSLRLGGFGKNLTDQLYYQNIFANDFGNAATGAPPAVYGLYISWEY